MKRDNQGYLRFLLQSSALVGKVLVEMFLPISCIYPHMIAEFVMILPLHTSEVVVVRASLSAAARAVITIPAACVAELILFPDPHTMCAYILKIVMELELPVVHRKSPCICNRLCRGAFKLPPASPTPLRSGIIT